MATGISALTAAELSNAAYPGGTPPTGWNAETPASPDGGANSLTVFVNQTTSQIVIAFKGSDNASNFESDFTNSGGSAWETMSPIFAQALANVQAQFPGYDVMTDGHSLGGGMAQTAALEYGLSGYGQNSLPISQTAANDPAITLQGGLTSAINTWVGSGNTFNEVNNAGDPATLLYSTTEGQAYLNTSTTTLDNPYVAAELAGATLSEIPGLNGVGIALAAWGALESHSLITLINNLQAQQGGTTGDSPAANAAATQNANATVSSVEAATPTDNSDGSISITVGNTPQYDFSLGTVGTDAVTYGMSGGGQNIQTVEVIVAGSGQIYGSTLTGINTIYDLVGGNQLNLSGTGVTAIASNDEISLTEGTLATLDGSGNAVGIGQNDTVTSIGGGNIISANGDASGSIFTLEGTGADADTLNLSEATVVGAAGDIASISGNNVTLNATGGQYSLTGTGDMVYASNSGINVTGGSSASIAGSGNIVTVDSGATVTINAADDNVITNGVSGQTITVANGNISVSGTADVVSGGASDVITVNANGSQTVSVFNAANEETESVQFNTDGSASDLFYNPSTGGLSGQVKYVYDTNGKLAYVNASGTAAVNASNTVINSDDADSALTVIGTGDTLMTGDPSDEAYDQTFTLVSGDSIEINDLDHNTINVGTGVALTLLGVDADVIHANGDMANGTTADGQVAGITLLQGAQANILGSDNTITAYSGTYVLYATNDVINLNGNDAEIEVGGGNEINAADGTTIYFNEEENDTVSGNDDIIFNSGSVLTLLGSGDIVTGSGTLTLSSNSSVTALGAGSIVTINAGSDSTGTLSNALATSITLGDDVIATIVGSDVSIVADGNNTVTGSNDNIAVIGSGSTISGSGDAITAAADLALNITKGIGVTVSGNGETMNLASSSVTLQGVGDSVVCGGAGGDTITLVAGTSASITDAIVTINAGAGDAVTITDAPSVVTINASDDLANGQTADGQTTGITLGSNIKATIVGGDNTVTAGGGNQLTASNDDITLAAGSESFVTGNDDDIVAANGLNLDISGTNDSLSGNDETIFASNDQGLSLQGTGLSVSGTGAAITLADDSSLTINQNSNGIDTGAGDTVTVQYINNGGFFAPPGDSIEGQAASVILGSDVQVYVYSSGDTIAASGADNVTANNASIVLAGNGTSVFGSDNAITGNNGVNVSIGVGDGNTITGNDDVISTGTAGLTLLGTGDQVAASKSVLTLSAGSSVTVSEGGDTINAAAGDAVIVASSAWGADTIDAINDTSGGITSDGQATGITLAANVTATVVGGGDTIVAQGGNTITASNDTLVANSAQVTVNGTDDIISGSNDAITLGADTNFSVVGSNEVVAFSSAAVTASSLSVQASAGGNGLIVTDTATGDQITLNNMLSTLGVGATQIDFANGSTLSALQLVDLETEGGTPGDDMLYGWSAGGNVFNGNGGDDVAIGHGNGDTFIFNQGYGQLEIDENDTSTNPHDVLQLGSGITEANLSVTMTTDGTGLVLTDGTAGDQITIDNMVTGNEWGVAQVDFADGSVLTAQQLLTMATPITGNTSAQTLTGTALSDVFNAATSGDTEVGAGGNDTYMLQSSSGSLTVENGVSTSVAASGTLSILNEAANNVWLKQVGNDLQVDIMGTQTEATIQGWFTNSYSQLNAITVSGPGGTASIQDSQVNQLVQAMASFSAQNPGFDPSSSTNPTITDPNLLTLVNSSFHTNL